MSKRDWGSYAWTGGAVAFLLAVIVLGNWANGSNNGRRDRQSDQAAQQEQRFPETPTRKHRVAAEKYQPRCDEPKSREEADVCAQLRMARSAKRTLRLTQIQTGIGVLGLGGLLYTMYLTLGALRESKRSADIAERALVAGHRAFVFASGIVPQWELDAPTGQYHWRIRPQWQNSGPTPARQLRTSCDCVIRDTPMPNDFQQPIGDPGTGLIGPNASSLGGAAPLHPLPPITPQDIADSAAGRKFIYLWGWVRYFDVFPGTPEHVTRFLWLIVTSGDPLVFAPEMALTDPRRLSFGYLHMRNANCADEECDQLHPVAFAP